MNKIPSAAWDMTDGHWKLPSAHQCVKRNGDRGRSPRSQGSDVKRTNQKHAGGQVRCVTLEGTRGEAGYSNRAPVGGEGGHQRRRGGNAGESGDDGSGGEGSSDGRVRKRTTKREVKYIKAYVPNNEGETPAVREERRSLVEVDRWRRRSQDANTRQRDGGGKELLPRVEETRDGVWVEMEYAPAGKEGEVIGPRWRELVDPSRPWLKLLGWQQRPGWRKRPLPRGGVIKQGSTAIAWNSAC